MKKYKVLIIISALILGIVGSTYYYLNYSKSAYIKATESVLGQLYSIAENQQNMLLSFDENIIGKSPSDNVNVSKYNMDFLMPILSLRTSLYELHVPKDEKFKKFDDDLNDFVHNHMVYSSDIIDAIEANDSYLLEESFKNLKGNLSNYSPLRDTLKNLK